VSRARELGFRLIRRAAPRTVENLTQLEEITAGARETENRVTELARGLERLRAENSRLRRRIEDLEKSRDEAELFGPRLAELADAVAVHLGRGTSAPGPEN
jgi:septal ring factor EnvC (AmiA/AmiB activator)